MKIDKAELTRRTLLAERKFKADIKLGRKLVPHKKRRTRIIYQTVT